LPAIACHAVWEPSGDVEDLILFKNRYRLSAGESGLDFMPIGDGFLAELPAEADIVPAVPADEIDEAHLIVLQIASDFMELIDVVLEVLNLSVELELEGRLILVLGGFQGCLQCGDPLVGLDDVGYDSANQGQRSVGLRQFELFGRP
jgi:hypothetical protein